MGNWKLRCKQTSVPCLILSFLSAVSLQAQVRTEYARLVAGDASSPDLFGYSVSIDGETLVTGAYGEDRPGCIDCGAAYVFEFNGMEWVQQAKLTASDAAASDVFGVSVAISGDTIVVGAPADDCVAGSSCGAAYVFVKPKGGWSDMTQTAKLTASDADALDVFGQAVAISGDDVVVSAFADDCVAGSDCGSAYVFIKPGGGWVNMTQNHKLTASDAAADDQFGFSVAIDTDTIVVGARWDDCASTTNCGSAYVYHFNGANWIQQAKLTASVDLQENLGVAVSISGDTIVAGAQNSDCAAGSNCGAAYVFVKPGASWMNMNETAKLTRDLGTAGTFFGRSVDIDGNAVVVGAPEENCPAGADCGSAYVYLKPLSGWVNMTQTAILRASDPAASDFLGESTSISDGTIVAGSFRDDCIAGNDCGSAYLFQHKNVIYVKSNAGGLNNGINWTNAFRNLQDALAVAEADDEIWVAAGTYKPDRGAGMTLGDRTATFQLLDGVVIYGGFNGTETLRSQRDIAANPTILSGDLLGNDTEVGCTADGECAALGSKCIAGYCIMLQNNAENSYHIVTGSATDDTAVLDGFSITAGNANGSLPHVHGAGLYNDSGSPTVSNCTFSRNWVVGGGGSGMVNLSNSNPVVTNCTFIRNSGISASGAGILNSLSNPQVTNCRFLSNYAGDGGGMANAASSPSVTNCLFNGNMAGSGGGMSNQGSSSPVLTNCIFTGNQATLLGGGIYNLNNSNPTIVSSSFMNNEAGDGGGLANDESHPIVVNCVFGRNSATNGGSSYNLNSSPSLVNCRFGGNIATLSGGAVYLNDSPATITNCTLHANTAGDFGGGVYVQWSPPTITNSVFWGNEDSTGMTGAAQIKNATFGFPTHYNIVQGGYTGSGSTNNINADPLFFDPDGVDGILGTIDDDLRLRAGSPAIDSGDIGALPPDTADVDNDGDTSETLPIDLAGNPRVTFVVFSNVDRGAYEYFPDCNNNGIDDTTDIFNSTSTDCLRLSVSHDCCEIHGPGCSDAPVQSCVCKIRPSCCSTTWDALCIQIAENSCDGCTPTNNGIPDECDLAQCTGDPGCDDCNLNGLPDGCDINEGDSDDVAPMDGIPDECSTFTGECTNQGQTQFWTCSANWDLGGDYPDDDDSAAGISVTLPEGLIAFLNETVVIPSLRLAPGSQANITQSGAQGDLYFSTPAMLNIEGHMHVSGDRNIGGAPGLYPTIVVGPDGRYEADHAAVAGGSITATLNASNLSIIGSDCFIPPCPHGGEVILTDSMEITTSGDLVVDGRYANGECELHRTGQTAALSFHTPPSIRVIGADTRVTVGTNVLLSGAAGFTLLSGLPFEISGNWENQSVRSDCFDAAAGILRLDGTNHEFEVAATDTGGQGPSADQFRMGSLEIATASTITFRDNFDNDLQSQASCGEALYVDTLVVEPGASLITQNCRIYYETLIMDPSSSIATLGCGEVRAAANPDPLGTDPSGLSKARAISFVPPSGAVAGGQELSALRVKLTSLHHVTPPYTGGASIPFTSFEGQIRWVGPPTQYLESTSSGVPLMAASLQCAPHYDDWSTVGLVHVFGSAVVPSSEYQVQSLAGSCAGIEDRCTAISAPLTIKTTRWGDVENPFNPPSTTVQPDVADIGALVNKFRSAPGAPIKARALLAGAPGNPFGEITPAVLAVDLGFSHISACVDAFRGVPYPYTIQSCP